MNGERRRIKDNRRGRPGNSVARKSLISGSESPALAPAGSRASRRKYGEDVADERPRRVETVIGVDETGAERKLVYDPIRYRAVTKKHRRNEVNGVGAAVRNDRSIRPDASVRPALSRMGYGERTGAPAENYPGVRPADTSPDRNCKSAYAENVFTGDTATAISGGLAGGPG